MVARLRGTAVCATCPKDGADYKEALPGLRVRCERAFEDLQKAADRLPENYRQGYAWALYEPRYGLTRAINEALAPFENRHVA